MAKGDLPKTVSKFGTKPEEIFVAYEELKAKYGNDFKDIPLGAVGNLYIWPEIQDRASADHGRQQKLQALDYLT